MPLADPLRFGPAGPVRYATLRCVRASASVVQFHVMSFDTSRLV